MVRNSVESDTEVVLIFEAFVVEEEEEEDAEVSLLEEEDDICDDDWYLGRGASAGW